MKPWRPTNKEKAPAPKVETASAVLKLIPYALRADKATVIAKRSNLALCSSIIPYLVPQRHFEEE